MVLDALVECYIKGEKLPPEVAKKKRTQVAWWGTSSKQNMSVVKELCAASETDFSTRVWDNDRKLWGTTRIENVIGLVESGLWIPLGIPESKTEAVTLEVKKIVDAQKAKEAAALEREEKRLKGENDKRAAEAAEKELERRNREDKANAFSEADIKDAWDKYGLTREILNATRHFPWLGPRTVRPMARIDRWFGFTHNKLAGANAVVARDFVPAYTEFCESKKQSSVASVTQNVSSKRKRTEKVLTMDQIRTNEKAKLDAIKSRLAAESTDEHALALKKIAEKQKNMPPYQAPYSRACPMCGVKPLEQFLDCGCADDQCMQWKVCKKCNVIFHESKMQCLCQ
jgi:hypothetical protein